MDYKQMARAVSWANEMNKLLQKQREIEARIEKLESKGMTQAAEDSKKALAYVKRYERRVNEITTSEKLQADGYVLTKSITTRCYKMPTDADHLRDR